MDLPDISPALHNPYVIGGGVVFLLVLYLSMKGAGGTGGVDPNAQLAAQTNTQLSAISSQDTQAATAANAQVAGLSVQAQTNQIHDLLAAYTSTAALQEAQAATMQTSQAAMYHDNIASIVAQQTTQAQIDMATINAGVAGEQAAASTQIAQIQSNAAVTVAGINATAQTAAASYTSTAQSAAAASQSSSSELGSVLGFGATALKVFGGSGGAGAGASSAASNLIWV